MANKSVTQQIVEVVAVLLAIAAIVPLVVIVGGRFWPQGGPQAKKPQPNAPAKPKPGPEPIREQVDSVAKLPASYPAIAEVVLATSSGPPPAKLEPAKPEALQGIRVRHLNAYTTGEVRLLPPDARLAIVDETTPANTHRLAVWDLEAGKLLRFLAGETKPTRPFQGKENADFGAPIDFESLSEFAISPSGKRFAARQGGSFQEDATAYAWEVATGRLLSRYGEPGEVYDIFLFPHDDYLVMSLACGERNELVYLRTNAGVPSVMRYSDVGLVRIDVNSGEAELLTPVGVGAGHISKGVERAGLIAYTRDLELHTVDVASRQHVASLPVALQGGISYACMWFAPDGSRLFGCNSQGQLDTWDLASLQRTKTVKLEPAISIDPVLAAPDAGLIVLHEGVTPNVSVFDVESGKRVTVLQLPFRKGRIKAISADARRLIVSTDQLSLLVVDFPERLPAGVIDLSKVLSESKLAATR